MGEAFLSLETQEQREILQAAADKSERLPAILEKDIWLCWVLQVLFSIPDRHPMAFKGGTSLSKVYKIIDRFSEDVDITLDYRAFNDGFDPFADGVSKTKINRFSDRLKSFAKCYTQDVVMPALAKASETLATCNQHTIRTDDSGEKVWFSYPSAVEDPDDYLASEVLLEFGGRNVIDPNEQHTIRPDIASVTLEIDYPAAAVIVLSPSRTFWEKATLIHVECNRGRLSANPERLSRHWYDLVCLGQHEIGRKAIDDRSLLENVIQHKKLFFNASYAHYDDCLAGKLRLIPDKDDLLGLQTDYKAMCTAGILSDDAPDFEALIGQVRAIENQVNCWP
ncbi:MAG: nucleotidyl transferase AbiEii/AbiGii toxin family protein [Gammaproteobacteria bacterium]|nr:nucleotidyl transferase AbiEii/AbiGii toxin family protein [Gammaproteobacteria bacterium]